MAVLKTCSLRLWVSQ